MAATARRTSRRRRTGKDFVDKLHAESAERQQLMRVLEREVIDSARRLRDVSYELRSASKRFDVAVRELELQRGAR
jgi:hypothetical protein